MAGRQRGEAVAQRRHAHPGDLIACLQQRLEIELEQLVEAAVAAQRLAQEEDVFFSENFLLPRPLMMAEDGVMQWDSNFLHF